MEIFYTTIDIEHRALYFSQDNYRQRKLRLGLPFATHIWRYSSVPGGPCPSTCLRGKVKLGSKGANTLGVQK